MFDHTVGPVGAGMVADSEPPGAPIRMVTEGAEFPEVDHGALAAFVAQHVGDDVRNITLGYAVERDRHARTQKADGG